MITLTINNKITILKIYVFGGCWENVQECSGSFDIDSEYPSEVYGDIIYTEAGICSARGIADHFEGIVK